MPTNFKCSSGARFRFRLSADRAAQQLAEAQAKHAAEMETLRGDMDRRVAEAAGEMRVAWVEATRAVTAVISTVDGSG